MYLLGVLVLSLFSAFVATSFLRYRFKGDRTYQFIGLFLIMFAATILLNLLLILPGSDPAVTPQGEIEFTL